MEKERMFEKDHLAGIMQCFYKFLTEKSFCDLTVCVEDQSFQLHKCVFAAACPMLYHMIQQAVECSCSDTLKLSLKSISALGFKAVLGFIYTGKFPKHVTSQLRREFVVTCEYLSLPYPYFEKGEIKMHQPSENVQVSLVPMSDGNSVKVMLQKDSIISQSSCEEILLEDAQQDQASEVPDVSVTEIGLATENSSVFELTDGITLKVQRTSERYRDIFQTWSEHAYSARMESPVCVLTCHHNNSAPENPSKGTGGIHKKLDKMCSACDESDVCAESSLGSEISSVAPLISMARSNPTDDTEFDNSSHGVCCFGDAIHTKGTGGLTPRKMHFYSADGVVRPHVCQICGASFTRQYSLKIHSETICQSRNPVKCLGCNKNFASVMSFKGHARRQHKGEVPEMIYISNEEHILAKKAKIEPEESQFQCGNCATVYASRHHFVSHLQKCKAVTSIKCPHCLKLFRSRREFDKHIWQCQGHQNQDKIDDEKGTND